MISNRDQRYSTIARACLAVLNEQSFHKKTQQQQISAVYTAIDLAFDEQQKKLLSDVDGFKTVLKEIQLLAEKGNSAAIIHLTTKILK